MNSFLFNQEKYFAFSKGNLACFFIYPKQEIFIVELKIKFMKIVKVIEVIATSEKGFEDAAQVAVNQASKSVKNIKSIYIKEMKAGVENNKITSYAVNAKISFEVENT